MKRSRRRGSPILRKRLSRISADMLRMRSRNMAENLISVTPSNSPSSTILLHSRMRVGGYESRLRKRVTEILADQRRLDDRLSVVHEPLGLSFKYFGSYCSALNKS